MKEFFTPSDDFFEAWGEVPASLDHMPGDVLLSPSCDTRDLSARSAKLLASPKIQQIIKSAFKNGQDVILDVVADVGTRLLIGRGIAQNEFSRRENRYTILDHNLIGSVASKKA